MKKLVLTGMAVLCASVAFVSCSHDSLYDENLVNQEKELSYEEAFIKLYGPISPTQDWDFTKAAASARTRKESGEKATKAKQFSDNSSFNWLWKYSDGKTGELPAADLNALWSVKGTIENALAAAPSITWDPSKYESVTFRLFTTLNDTGAQKTYHRFGFSNGTQNYWLVQGLVDKGYDYWYDGYIGSLFMDHTRHIDFTKLKESNSNIRWFAISQKAGSESAFYASEHEIGLFKEATVKVTVNGKEYTETFWAFNCSGVVGSNDNMILWVRPTKVPDVVKSKRYMCEDLGSVKGSDIDFNDIVFDMVDTNGKQKCYVRALGGTLDIAIKITEQNEPFFKKAPTFEKTNMINTGWDEATKTSSYDRIKFDDPIAEIEVTGWNPETNNVQVIVYNPNATNAEGLRIIDFPGVGTVPKMVAVDPQRKWKEEKTRVPDFNWFLQFERK